MMSGAKFFRLVFALLVWGWFFAGGLAWHAQTVGSGTIQGTVKDPSGAVVPNAQVEITNPVSQYTRTTKTGSQGEFLFANVPYNPYHLTITAQGFATYVHDVEARSAVPVTLEATLAIGTTGQTVTVTTNAEDLIENTPTDHTDVDRGLFDTLPLESSSSALSSLVTLSSPGIAADSNGLMHGLGDHAENSFSLDDQPITDQQSKVFSNQIPVDAVQSLEVIEGAPPAEYGDKTSLIVKVTSRSGLGVTQPTGSITTSYGSFGTENPGFNLAFGGQKWGNFVSANGLQTGRFLDGPEYEVMHDKGNEENFFDRVDYKFNENNSIQMNGEFTRSWFQTPNSYDAEDAAAWGPTFDCQTFGYSSACNGLGPNGLPVPAQDQRSKIITFDLAPSFTHVISSNSLVTFGFYARRDAYNYYPSADPFADLTPDLQSESIAQYRTLLNTGLRGQYSYVKGINNIKAGITYEQTFLTEDDQFGLVNPTSNPVCLNADGSAVTTPSVVSLSQCGTVPGTGTMANPGFIPIIGCYDLTRPSPDVPQDGCTNALAAYYPYHGHTDVKELGMFLQDTISKGPWSLNLGIRGDFYNGISERKQAEPRVGLAYNIRKTGTVLRLSYARTLESPFNENLVLSSIGCDDTVIAAIMLIAQGFPCSTTPLSPGWRNEFHAGFEQAFGKYLVVDGEYIWKYTHYGFDFNVLGNSPITLPIEWQKSKIPGWTLRASMPNLHGFTALVVMSSVAARFFPPTISGIAPPAPPGVFRIDHDERYNQTTHLQYQPWKVGPWFGFNWRYDSGLVAGPVPCAGGEDCINGPAGTDSVVDVSALSPDQQFEAGLFCGSVHATITTPISSNLGADLCPANEYGSNLVRIPAAGTEDDDHNPPRVSSRNLFDVAVGDDNLFRGEHYRWSLRLSVINLANKVALYNFLSTFSGTHYVTPRTETLELGFHF
jgi:Carboxypeptidase regulatory-like domain